MMEGEVCPDETISASTVRNTGGQVAQFCAIRSRARVLISRFGLFVYHQAQFEIHLRNVR